MSSESTVSEPLFQRHRYSRAEYHAMAEAGIFHEDDRIELIDGEIVDMAAIGNRHYRAVNVLTELLVMALHGRAIVSIQNPVVLDDWSEPEPDVTVFRYRPDHYRGRDVTARDAFLIIEVAASSLRYDREIKLPLYARHHIPEVWVVDLDGERVTQFRELTATGYARRIELDNLASVNIAALEVNVDLREVF